jgi:glycosyltransferase involved in cell wall biosynthesis
LRLRHAIDRLSPDIIHSNGIKSHLLAAAARQRRTKVIWHIRDFIGARPLIGVALRSLSFRVDLAIAITEAVAADARLVLPKLRIQRIYDAIDTEAFSPGPSSIDLDDLAGLPRAPEGTVRIGLLATYARWKGQDLFLRAAAVAIKAAPTWPVRFFVIGGPLYATQGSQFSPEELRSLASGLGIQGKVGFIPFQSNPEEVVRALDIAVHASTRPEPFGRTIVEGMSTAKPVIATRAGGARELFEDGVTAIGFNAGDVEDLARALLQMRSDTLRETLSANARGPTIDRFSRLRLRQQLPTLYRQLLGT